MSIPLHLITGFLGSGKTSFLDHYLKKSGIKSNIAIIQNEFSPVNIDGRKFHEKTNYQVLEINNGSVFCVCLLGSFINSLEKFVEEYQPNLILMETSGLSDPIGVGQIFQSSQLKGKVFLEHVWCLVDASNYGRVTSLQLRQEHQLRSADTIILNKIDLANERANAVLEKIKKINPFARFLKSKYGEVDVSGYKKALNFFPEQQVKPLDRPETESVVIRTTRPIDLKMLNLFLNHIKKNSFRCKGFVHLKNGKTVFVQGVFDDYSIREIDYFSDAGDLVLIGDFDDGENLQLLFDEYCKK